MTKKNRWLPGGAEFGNGHSYDEPGLRQDENRWRRGFFPLGGPTPLGDVIQAIILLLLASAIAVWALTRGIPLNLGAGIVLGAFIAFAVVASIWLVRRAIVRQTWRRRNVVLNGGTLLRAWQATPRGLNKPRD